MTCQAKTDSEHSLAADEFIWNGQGLTHAHDYIKPTLLSWLSKSKASTVLDLGCGNGALTAELVRRGYDATGLDVSRSGIAIASRTHPQVPFIAADLETSIPKGLKGQFDCVIAIEVIEHLLRPRCLLDRARE